MNPVRAKRLWYFPQGLFLTVTVCAWLLLAAKPLEADLAEARLDFSLHEDSAGRVTFVIDTTIPTPFEAVVEIALAGQQPRDIFIGHAERVFIDRPSSEIVVDLNRSRMSLPAGTYLAKVAYYNSWGWRNGNRRAADTPDTVIRKSVLLRASGTPPAQTRSRSEKQRWIFLNVKPQTRWVPQFFTRNIGNFEQIESGDLSSFYFPEAQVTFLVSAGSGQIVGWRFGKRDSAEADDRS